MLANRADTYNLGEIIGDNADAFKMSYLENCLTSNPVLDKLASRSQKDVYGIIKMAESNTREGVDLEGNYSLEEVNEMVSVMQKLMRVRDVVLAVNEEYIRSASIGEEYRTEPAFKLQGSYRNMNRIAEKVYGIMNDEELETLILTNYQNDAQTLTSGAESNMLKFKELTHRLSPEEAARWADIKKTFSRNLQMKGLGEDEAMGQLLLQLTNFSDGLDAISQTLNSGVERMLKKEERPIGGDGSILKTSFDTKTLGAIKAMVSEMKTAYAAGSQVAPPPKPQKEIRMITKVPKSILHILHHQLQLMESWMEPVYKETQKQGKDLQKIRKLIAENLRKYEALVDDLQAAIIRKYKKTQSEGESRETA